MLLTTPKPFTGTRDTHDIRPLSKEDQEWLTKVFDDLVVDPVARMKVLVATIRIPEDLDDIEALQAALAESKVDTPQPASLEDVSL